MVWIGWVQQVKHLKNNEVYMALTDGDKALCVELARAIIKEVLSEHIKVCPHGQTLNMMRAKFFGVCIGIGVASGGVVSAIMQFFK